jgi:NAD(P)-dependent dehydrogenase (short-subunit alcohol dehydrogenase family)
MNTPVVLITGALTGIGRAAALAFAKSATVVVSGRRDAEGNGMKRRIVRQRHGVVIPRKQRLAAAPISVAYLRSA